MKKILVLMMTLAISLNLIACAGEEITLQSQTVYNLTLDVPSDFSEFTEVAEQVKMASNEEKTAVITISERIDAGGITADLWDEETFAANMLAGLGDLQVLKFSNTETVAGTTAVYSHYTGKNSSDTEAEGHNYLLYFDDGTFQSIAFNFTKGAESSLKQNLTAVIDSIK